MKAEEKIRTADNNFLFILINDYPVKMGALKSIPVELKGDF